MIVRRLLGALVVALARLVRWGFYRRVEVVGLEQMPRRGPVLIVANHYNGLLDAVLVVATLGRLPRFVAKSTLGTNPLVRALLWGLGAVLVKRPQDIEGSPGLANREMFAATSAALAGGDTVVIDRHPGRPPRRMSAHRRRPRTERVRPTPYDQTVRRSGDGGR